jgi:hypothetical protein
MQKLPQDGGTSKAKSQKEIKQLSPWDFMAGKTHFGRGRRSNLQIDDKLLDKDNLSE